jgi:hypothetical protein
MVSAVSWRKLIFVLVAAALVWLPTLFIPIYTVPGPRGGTIYVSSFYGTLLALVKTPETCFSQPSALSAILVVGVIPVLTHIFLCLGVGYSVVSVVCTRAD